MNRRRSEAVQSGFLAIPDAEFDESDAFQQMWIYRALYALMLATLCGVVISLSTGEFIRVDQKNGDLDEDVKTFDNFILPAFFTALKYFVMIGWYVAQFALSMAQSPLCPRPARGQASYFRCMQQ